MGKVNYDEFYGIRNLMIAPVTIDDDGNETWGTPQRLSGVQSISKEVSETSETHYYDNQGAIVVSSEGDDTYTLTVSVVDKETRALIEGLSYDVNTGALIGTTKNKSYFALGYIAETVNGTEEFVWVYKGKFTSGTTTHNTKSDSIDTSNMEYTYTSIQTNKEFTNYGTAKFLMIDNNGLIDEDKFFGSVIEPDGVTDSYFDDMSSSIASPASEEETWLNMNISDLQADMAIKSNGAVTGTLKYVTGFTGFNSADTSEQSGYYFAFTLGSDVTGTTMTFRKDGVVTKSNIAYDNEIIFRIPNKNTKFEVLVDGVLVLTLTFKNVTFAS